jgi:xanthine dehydrogenase small subunit
VQSKAEFISDKRVSSEISISKNKIKIGGAVTIQQLLESSIIQKHFPSLRKQLELFGSLPIRNRATVAGNLVNASPIGDITNVLLALDSKIILKGKRNRTIPIRKFYKGYKILDKGKNEFVDSVFFIIPSKKFYFSYEKVSKRTYLDIASVNTTAMITLNKNKIQSIGLSAGGVAPVPLNLLNTCKYLKGKVINSETIKCASEIAINETSPISDARGSKEYKRLLLRQLFFAHFIKLFSNKIKAEELI